MKNFQEFCFFFISPSIFNNLFSSKLSRRKFPQAEEKISRQRDGSFYIEDRLEKEKARHKVFNFNIFKGLNLKYFEFF